MSISQKIHSGDKIVSLFDNMCVHKLISIKCMYVLLYVNYFPFFDYSRPYTSSENAVYNDITLSYIQSKIFLYRNFANQIVQYRGFLPYATFLTWKKSH